AGRATAEDDEAEVEAEEEAEGTLREVMRRYEGRIIRRALHKARGSVTQAARALGLSHQALIYTLEHRHKDLLVDRRPVHKRRRSVVKSQDEDAAPDC
ncbi:MAG TPA: helix-turn-helix domain-containing protein, partial [Pyrinomonadaceae bacterium]|nr:helix-turn-helix domain-containing protein [Pyrinomonadaceae bacterium]